MTGSAAALVSFEESSALLHELAGVEVSAKQLERAAEALGAEIADDERRDVERMGNIAPTMYLGMDGTGVPMRAVELVGREASNRMVLRKLGKPRWLRRGVPNRVTKRVSQCETRGPSRIPPRLKAPRLRIRAWTGPTSPSAYCAKLHGGASPKPPVAWCWVTALPGSGTLHGNYFPKPLESSIATMPKRYCTERLNRSAVEPTKLKPGHKRAAPNWTMASCTPSSTHSVLTSHSPLKPPNARTTSSIIALACATQNSTRKDSVLPPASSRLDAKS